MRITARTYRPTSVAAPSAATYPLYPDPYSLTFAFSAKERDTETGLSYFGARYYSSDLSIWLSVDPMSDKYPSLSPYVYCADNPVKLVDPNGKDYEVVVDDKARTITIKATFYSTNEGNINQILEASISDWNKQSGLYSYVVGEGDDAVSYTINFELTSIICEKKDIFRNARMPASNSFADKTKDLDEMKKNGQYLRDVYAQIDISLKHQDFSIFRTTTHEIGHALGCGEFSPNPAEIIDYGVMIPGGDGEQIRSDYISSMLNHAGFNCSNNESEPTSTCLVVVRGNIPSRQGKVQKKN